ncbi:MAG: glycosyltransferase family 39 protein [Planctomycetes bacterium]|nr:glycosyltransferase family 39 protein [Planctomycetota bacterium]
MAKVLLAVLLPATSDESYHWLQGQHLAWGFTDHPPGTAALNWLATELLGASRPGLRLVPIVGMLLCSWLAWAMLRELGADRRRAGAAAVAVQLVPMVGFGVLMVPSVPHAPIVFAAEFALLRALRRGRARDHVLWGLLLGAAMLTYYLAAAAVVAAFAFLALDRQRRSVLRDPRLWLGGLAALAVFAPNLLWNLARGDGGAVHFQAVERHGKGFTPVYFVAFGALAVALAGPLLLPALGRAVRSLRRGPVAADDWRPWFASFVLVVLGLFAVLALTTRVGAHWAVLAYLNVPLLLLAPHAEPLGRGWWRAAVATSVVLAAGGIGLAAAGVDRIQAWLPTSSLVGRERSLHTDRAAAAALRWADEVAASGRPVLLASDRWSFSSLLSFHAFGRGEFTVLPPPARHGRDFRSWGERAATPLELIYVSTTPEVAAEVRAACASVQLLDAVAHGTEFAWIHRGSGFVWPAAWR